MQVPLTNYHNYLTNFLTAYVSPSDSFFLSIYYSIIRDTFNMSLAEILILMMPMHFL